ncbi:YoaK family protein [Chryseobacterium sp. A301]
MFRHTGNKRTFSHNLQLASLLSGVAGIVNITGILALGVLTTNVTGHFAFFSEDLVGGRIVAAFAFLVYIVMFLLGAFVSSLLLEIGAAKGNKGSYLIPISIEIILLVLVSFEPQFLDRTDFVLTIFTPSVLLFVMGLQNALVTRVSQSVVRTTHLTGLFTDLGIELSQILFYRKERQQKQLRKNIYLKLAIIAFFFLGGIGGGLLYPYFGLRTLLVSAALLLFALYYDRILQRYHDVRRHFQRPE